MHSLVKAPIMKFFAVFGVGIYRLPPAGTPKKAIDFSPRPGIGATPIDFNLKDNVDRQYSDRDRMEAYLSPDRLAAYDDLARFPQSKGIDCNGKHVADVGCGSGHFLFSLSKVCRPASMTGIDFSDVAIETARATLPEASFFAHDIYDSSRDYQFDILFCSETLEHLLFPDKALRNLLSWVRKPGIAIISVPNGRIDQFAGHINFWSPESWQVFVTEVCKPYGADVETGVSSTGVFAIIRLP